MHRIPSSQLLEMGFWWRHGHEVLVFSLGGQDKRCRCFGASDYGETGLHPADDGPGLCQHLGRPVPSVDSTCCHWNSAGWEVRGEEIRGTKGWTKVRDLAMVELFAAHHNKCRITVSRQCLTPLSCDFPIDPIVIFTVSLVLSTDSLFTPEWLPARRSMSKVSHKVASYLQLDPAESISYPNRHVIPKNSQASQAFV